MVLDTSIDELYPGLSDTITTLIGYSVSTDDVAYLPPLVRDHIIQLIALNNAYVIMQGGGILEISQVLINGITPLNQYNNNFLIEWLRDDIDVIVQCPAPEISIQISKLIEHCKSYFSALDYLRYYEQGQKVKLF